MLIPKPTSSDKKINLLLYYKNTAKIVVSFVCFNFMISCNKDYYLERDRDILIPQLKEMIDLDQSNRGISAKLKDSFIRSQFTSIEKDSFNNMKQDWEKRPYLEKKFRVLVKNKSKDFVVIQKQRDSLWKIQAEIDYVNTKKLIEIVKKYGFPSVDRLEAPVAAWLIFQHAPSSFWPELKTIVAKELKKGNLPSAEAAMLNWHLNGRKGTPFIPGVNVIDSKQKGE